MNTLVEVDDLWYAYPLHGATEARSEPEWALRGVSFTLQSGEFACLLGPSGAGKTTLALALNGSVPQSTGGKIRGSVRVAGLDTKRAPVAELARHAGVGFQDPETQFLGTTVEADVAFGLENLGVPAKEIRARVARALSQVGMAELGDRPPTELSGGQKQRVGIAALLAIDPPLLVLDEPTASLDPAGASDVFDIIADLKGRRTVLMATQDTERTAAHADRVLVLDRGRLVMDGPPGELLMRVDELHALGVRPPQVCELAHCLNRERAGPPLSFVDLEAAVRALQPERVP